MANDAKLGVAGCSLRGEGLRRERGLMRNGGVANHSNNELHRSSVVKARVSPFCQGSPTTALDGINLNRISLTDRYISSMLENTNMVGGGHRQQPSMK